MAATDPTHGDQSHGMMHVSPVSMLIGIWVALIALTVITVWSAGLDFGRFNLWIAMLIASTKATLVALYYMHLRYDRPFNVFVFIAGLLFVALLIGVTLMDTIEYQPDLIPGYSPSMDSVGPS